MPNKNRFVALTHKSGSFTAVVRNRKRTLSHYPAWWWKQVKRVPAEFRVPTIAWAYTQKASVKHSGPVKQVAPQVVP